MRGAGEQTDWGRTLPAPSVLANRGGRGMRRYYRSGRPLPRRAGGRQPAPGGRPAVGELRRPPD